MNSLKFKVRLICYFCEDWYLSISKEINGVTGAQLQFGTDVSTSACCIS